MGLFSKNKNEQSKIAELSAGALIKNELMIQVLSELLCKAKILKKKDIEDLYKKKEQEAEKISKSIENTISKLIQETKDRIYDDKLKNTPDSGFGNA